MNAEIDAQDVIRLMLQYMKENSLHTAMRALQSESGVSMNTVDNVDNLVFDIQQGKWESVLMQVATLQLPQDKFIALYEQIALELIEARDIDVAREFIRTTEPLGVILKQNDLLRYMKLEHMCAKPYFHSSDAYAMGSSKDIRRREIADAIACEVSVAPSSRLLMLLGQAMKFQQIQGSLPKQFLSNTQSQSQVQLPDNPTGTGTTSASAPVNLDGGDNTTGSTSTFDLFRGDAKHRKKDAEEKFVKKQMGVIHFPVESHPEAVAFSPDGASLLTGSIDGFVELWDVDQCALRKDLEYQAKDELMMHKDGSNNPVPILCSTFSKDGDYLATGSQDGQLKVWKISNGTCIRKFAHAHTSGITSICFTRNNMQVLTTSFDMLARVHGLKSGKLLKEFRGHTSYVNCAIITQDGTHVVTGSSDATCRLWDYQTTECLLAYRPGLLAGDIVMDASVINIFRLPHNVATASEMIIVCTKFHQAYLLTVEGKLIRSFTSGKQYNGNFTCATVSPQGKYLYCAGEDGNVYIFDTNTGKLEHILEVTTTISKKGSGTGSGTGSGLSLEIIGLSHHAQRNVIATTTDDGQLVLWKP